MKIERIIKVLNVAKLQNTINQQMEMFGQCEPFLQQQLDKAFIGLDNEEMDLFLDVMLKQNTDKKEVEL